MKEPQSAGAECVDVQNHNGAMGKDLLIMLSREPGVQPELTHRRLFGRLGLNRVAHCEEDPFDDGEGGVPVCGFGSSKIQNLPIIMLWSSLISGQ